MYRFHMFNGQTVFRRKFMKEGMVNASMVFKMKEINWGLNSMFNSTGYGYMHNIKNVTIRTP